MNKRLDPTQSFKNFDSGIGMVNFGDRAKTLNFGEDAMGFKMIGGPSVPDLLKEIARTNDWKWDDGGDNKDGGNKNVLELQNADKTVADDFVEFVKAAIEGKAGLSLNVNAANKITVEAEGHWSTDHLVFEGDYVKQAFAEIGAADLPLEIKKSLAVSDPSWYADTFGNSHINNGNYSDQIGVYEFTLADDREQFYWSHDKNLDPEVQALFDKINAFFQDEDAVELVQAALAEKFGLADISGLEYCGDDGEAIVINLEAKGSTVDTVVLHGDEIEAILEGFGAQFGGILNMSNPTSQVVFYDTDAAQTGSVFMGGANKVFLDAAKTQNVDDVVGNGLTQKEDNINREWEDDIDEFIFAALSNDGDNDVNVIAGGQAGDEFLTVAMSGHGNGAGTVDTLILEGERVGDAIDQFAADGTQFDFFA